MSMTKDQGLYCLAKLANLHGIAVDTEQLIHKFCPINQPAAAEEILRAARSLGIRAKRLSITLADLKSTLCPAIAELSDGGFALILGVRSEADEAKLLVLFVDEASPKTLTGSDFALSYSGNLLIFKPETSQQSPTQKFGWRWFIPSLVKYRALFGEVILISFFLQVFALATPLFFQLVMDKVLVHRGFTTLDVLAFGFFVIALFDALLGGMRNYLYSHTANRVDVELGARLYQHLLALPVRYFEMRQVGQSVARVRELDSIRNFITGSALTLLIDLSFTLIFFLVMWLYSPLLTAVVLGTIPAYLILSLAITPVLRRRLDQSFQYGAANQAFLVESITGVETVKSMSLEPQMQRKWEDQLARYVQSNFRAQNLNNIANQIAGFINKITTLMILWFGAHLVIEGRLTVGELIAFNMIAGRVSAPLLKLVQLWQDFQQARISMERLGDLLDTPSEQQFSASRSQLPKLNGALTFEHVCFRYHPEASKTLTDINLQVKPGEVIGVVGRSGSGKSTLTKLIQRSYHPESGRVLVDGADLCMIDIAWLRRQVGVVLQESFLFNGTVRENIAIQNPAMPLNKVIAAAKLAGAHDFITELPQSYDYPVGEQGTNLSGGQKQRLAIARALLTDPKILIFDEATSALDYESEAVIKTNMSSIAKNRTTFIIAHRLSTVRHCDRILVMDRGRIVEQGTHSALLAQQGIYWRLDQLQSGEPGWQTESAYA